MGLFENKEQIEEAEDTAFISAMCQLADGLLDDLLFNIMTGLLIFGAGPSYGGSTIVTNSTQFLDDESPALTPAPTPRNEEYSVNEWTWISLAMSLVMIVKRVLISYYNFIRPFQRYCFEDSAQVKPDKMKEIIAA